MRIIKLSALLLLPLLLNKKYAQITLHSEDFASGLGSWTAIDVTDATDVWSAASGYAEINGFGGSDDEDWIISPAINMNGQTDEYFMFDYLDSYNGSLIELYYSTDYNGGGTATDLTTATWTSIPLQVLDVANTTCITGVFMRHPAIDISGINGSSVYFAFKYVGTSSYSKSYQLDNIRILAEYYSDVQAFIATGGNCDQLKTEIYNTLTVQYDELSYTSSTNFDVWDAILIADRRLNDAGTDTIVWDMFTDIPSGTGEFEFDLCGNRDDGSCPGTEGACYNREHTFPRSWWGGTTTVADTINFDMHHITPADKAMNTLKSNYPLGIVQTTTGTGSNGMKVGTNSSYPCGTGNFFEPIDEFKGDYARMYLYVATRYEPVIAGWATNSTEAACALSGDSYTVYNPWLLNLLLTWHAQDPVSQKEIDRNNAIYSMQGNRNPYIDNPEWVGYVWGDYLGNSCATLAPGPCTPTTGSETQSACDTYTWLTNGQTYTSSGAYTAVLTNAAGCDSTVTLNLTINSSNSGSESVTECDSYTWTANSMTYTTSGTYTATLTNVSGCDSIATLNLTINNSTSGSESITACDSYTWTANNMTYTTSGTYTATLTNAAGCDSVATLNLTINSSNSGSESVSACDSYTWAANSMTYTNSGIYTATLQNVNGCDSIATLNLTIGNSNSGSETQTACDSFMWSANNQTYTTSGTYTATLTNVSGCDSVATLNLTITNSTSGSESISTCSSYTWAANNMTYTTSGTYTATLTNAAGCDSVATLNLTINSSNSGSESVSACDSYTWAANSMTYSTSGTYTATLQNVNGCDSVATLNLTVISIDTSVTQSGTTLTSNDNSGSYQWIDCDANTAITGENSISYIATSNGNYAVEITNGTCVDTSYCYTISGVGIEEMNAIHFELFPNPATEVFTIKSLNTSSYLFEMLDVSGALVMSQQVNNYTSVFDISDLTNGVYIVKIKANGLEVQKRVVISK